eukprot:Opistho-2@56458
MARRRRSVEKDADEDDELAALITTTPIQTELPSPKCWYNKGTLCDNPQMRDAYRTALEQERLESANIKLRVHIIADDDGENPILPDSDTQGQIALVNSFFVPVGLTFDYEISNVNMSRLRYGALLPSNICKPEQVGNGVFDIECMGAFSGFDGGDGTGVNAMCDDQELCDPTTCTYGAMTENPNNDCACVCAAIPEGHGRTCLKTAADGVCDPACNFNKYEWDRGDCCLTATAGTCRDPKSPHRNWLDRNELKEIINDSGSNHMNQFVSPFYIEPGVKVSTMGSATFPWEETVFTPLGGVIFSATVWGPGQYTAPHEYGHVLGLLHTHVGLSDSADIAKDLQSKGYFEPGTVCDAFR